MAVLLGDLAWMHVFIPVCYLKNGCPPSICSLSFPEKVLPVWDPLLEDGIGTSLPDWLLSKHPPLQATLKEQLVLGTLLCLLSDIPENNLCLDSHALGFKPHQSERWFSPFFPQACLSVSIPLENRGAIVLQDLDRILLLKQHVMQGPFSPLPHCCIFTESLDSSDTLTPLCLTPRGQGAQVSTFPAATDQVTLFPPWKSDKWFNIFWFHIHFLLHHS